MSTDLAASHEKEVQLVRVAREIAMDLNDTETILKNNKIEPKQWSKLKNDPRFLRVLESEVAAWNAAANTHERTKLKSAALIEEWLLEANTRIHDDAEALPAKTEVVKLLARIAGMGNERVDPAAAAGGQRFSVTINMGADRSINITKSVTPEVIEGHAVEISSEDT